MQRLTAAALEPSRVFGVLGAFQQLLVISDGYDNRDGFASARYNFGFVRLRFHGGNLASIGVEVKRLRIPTAGFPNSEFGTCDYIFGPGPFPSFIAMKSVCG